MKPREFFPNMPDDVFDNWLGEIIKIHGWPFKHIHDTCDYGPQWINCFAPYTKKDWARAEWELVNITPQSLMLRNNTNAIIEDITLNAIMENYTRKFILDNSKDRFLSCVSFFKTNGTIPAPIIFFRFMGKDRIIDGFHRIAAIFHIGFPPDLTIPAWEAKFK